MVFRLADPIVRCNWKIVTGESLPFQSVYGILSADAVIRIDSRTETQEC